MAAAPNYEATKRSASVILDNALGTTSTGAVLVGVSAGTRVKEIRLHSSGSASPGASKKVAVILDDGTNATVIDIVTLTDTLNVRQAILRYDNVFLVGIGCSIKFQMTAALTSGATLHCEVLGADF